MAENEASDIRSEHYSAVLSDLRAQQAELEIAIAAIQRRMGIAPGASLSAESPAAPSRSGGEIQAIRPDEFFNMNILDATERYLNIMKKPQSLGSISSALDRGGLIHQSKNFGATVFTTLRRAEDRGDRVVRFQKQWALGAWYPNRPRATKDDRPKRGKAKKSVKRPAAPPKLKLAAGDAKPPETAGVSTASQPMAS